MDKEKNSIERQKFQMTQKGFETIGKNLEKIANKKDVQKVEIQGASIVTIKGDKGDDGHTPTDTELLAIIKPLIPVLRQPEDGHTPTEDELLDLIRPLIPKVKDGETPSDERLLSLIKPLIPEEVDTQKIVEEVKKLSIEELKALIPESDTAEQIIKKLLSIKKAWLPAEAIDGDIVQHITRVVKQFGGTSGVSDAKVREIIADMPSSFITLKDTFDSYTGLAGKGLRVNATEDGIDTYIPTDTDEKVAYKSGSTPGYLKDVTVAGTGITLSEGTGGDAGKLKIINNFTETDPLSIHLNGDNSPTANIDWGAKEINNISFVGNKTNILIPDPTDAVLTLEYGTGPLYDITDYGYSWQYRIVYEKIIDGVYYYSNYVESNTVVDTGTGESTYRIKVNVNLHNTTYNAIYVFLWTGLSWDIHATRILGSGEEIDTFYLNIGNAFSMTLGPTYPFLGDLTNFDLKNDILKVGKLGRQTTNGFIKTINSDGTISVDTNTYEQAGVCLKLDQTTPQTVTGGQPTFSSGLVSGNATANFNLSSKVLGGITYPLISGTNSAGNKLSYMEGGLYLLATATQTPKLYFTDPSLSFVNYIISDSDSESNNYGQMRISASNKVNSQLYSDIKFNGSGTQNGWIDFGEEALKNIDGINIVKGYYTTDWSEAYGLKIEDVNEIDTDNYAIKTGLGKVSLGGNVLIGTSTDNGQKLQVNGTITCTSITETTPTLFKLDQSTPQTVINGTPEFSRGLSSNITSTATDGIAVSLTSSNTAKLKRAGVFIAVYDSTSPSSLSVNGINAQTGTASTASGNLTSTAAGGGLRNRYLVNHLGSGLVSKSSVLTTRTIATGGDITTASNYYSESPNVGTGKTITDFAHLNIEGAAITGAVTNYYGLLIGDISEGTTLNYAIKTGTGPVFFGDKLVFTQTDGNEYIDSLADGYMDYGATTAHRFLADIKLTADNRKLYFGAGDDASIYYDGTNAIINPKEVGSGYLNVKGTILADDYVYEKGTYAEIYLNNGSTAQSIPTGATYTKITSFTTNGNYSNCTPDATNDKITVTKAGKYRVTLNASSQSGTAGVTFTTAIFINGTEVTNNHLMRKFLNANDTFSASMTGIEVIGANQDIDIRVKHDNGGSVDITPIYLNLNVEYIGE